MAKKSAAQQTEVTPVNQKAIKELVQKGKKQGHLTYEEINRALPEDLLSPDQIDETLMIFEELAIEIIDEKKKKVIKAKKKTKTSKTVSDSASYADFGTVTDPVKMYLREMGMVTLLSREGEVEIAKK